MWATKSSALMPTASPNRPACVWPPARSTTLACAQQEGVRPCLEDQDDAITRRREQRAGCRRNPLVAGGARRRTGAGRGAPRGTAGCDRSPAGPGRGRLAAGPGRAEPLHRPRTDRDTRGGRDAVVRGAGPALAAGRTPGTRPARDCRPAPAREQRAQPRRRCRRGTTADDRGGVSRPAGVGWLHGGGFLRRARRYPAGRPRERRRRGDRQRGRALHRAAHRAPPRGHPGFPAAAGDRPSHHPHQRRPLCQRQRPGAGGRNRPRAVGTGRELGLLAVLRRARAR